MKHYFLIIGMGLLIGLTSCNPYLDLSTREMYKNIFSLDGRKIEGYDFEVDVITPMKEGSNDPFRIAITLNPSSRKSISVSEARQVILNFYLDCLHYLNTKMDIQNKSKDIDFNGETFKVRAFFGDYNFKDHEPGSARTMSIGQGRLWISVWREQKPIPPEPLEMVIENMLSEGKIRHPEYLKWLDLKDQNESGEMNN